MNTGNAVMEVDVLEPKFDKGKLSQRCPSYRRLRKLRTAWLLLLEERFESVLGLKAARIQDYPAIFALRQSILKGIHFPFSLHSGSTQRAKDVPPMGAGTMKYNAVEFRGSQGRKTEKRSGRVSADRA
jgi:hypothetical protein